MTFHREFQALLLFGGGTEIVGSQRNDTWAWDGTEWTQVNTNVLPSPRFGAAFAYHAAEKCAVLFGGNGNNFLGDTWALLTRPTPRINSITRLENGHVVVEGVGAPNRSTSIEASPDLNSGFDFIGNVTSDASGAFQFEDAAAVSATKRFYRLAVP